MLSSVREAVIERATIDGEPRRQLYLGFTGSYDDVDIIDNQLEEELHLPEAKESTEDYLRNMVGTLLGRREGRPVILLDIGAAAALSALRIAREYQTAIAQGALAIVATNLNTTMNEYVDALAHTSIKITGNPAELYAQAKDDVHEIMTDFMPGRSYGITLPSGETIDLRGNVTLAHEDTSLTAWGTRLDRQLPEVGSLIAPDGTYLVSQYSYDHLALDAKRRAAIGGASLIRDYNLHPIRHVEAGHHAGRTLDYVAFKAPEAPLLTV